MKSKIEIWRDFDGLNFRGVVVDGEYPRLDGFDRALVSECSTEGADGADWLLALECIFRRMREQNSDEQLQEPEIT